MIRTKVAKVLNPLSVILAAGFEDGVKEGMEFIIYDLSETIYDPETGEDLGKLEIVKGRVYAVHVQDRLTWAQTRSRKVERVIDPLGGLSAAASIASVLGKRTITETVHDKLRVAEPETESAADSADLIVRVGDKARSVYKPEFALAKPAS